jgi:hypothetical protein
MNSDPNFHPIYTVAKTAIEQLRDVCLSYGAARAAGEELLAHWTDAIRDWGGGGPSGPDVEQMILGDLRDTVAALEEVIDQISGQRA